MPESFFHPNVRLSTPLGNFYQKHIGEPSRREVSELRATETLGLERRDAPNKVPTAEDIAQQLCTHNGQFVIAIGDTDDLSEAATLIRALMEKNNESSVTVVGSPSTLARLLSLLGDAFRAVPCENRGEMEAALKRIIREKGSAEDEHSKVQLISLGLNGQPLYEEWSQTLKQIGAENDVQVVPNISFHHGTDDCALESVISAMQSRMEGSAGDNERLHAHARQAGSPGTPTPLPANPPPPSSPMTAPSPPGSTEVTPSGASSQPLGTPDAQATRNEQQRTSNVPPEWRESRTVQHHGFSLQSDDV